MLIKELAKEYNLSIGTVNHYFHKIAPNRPKQIPIILTPNEVIKIREKLKIYKIRNKELFSCKIRQKYSHNDILLVIQYCKESIPDNHISKQYTFLYHKKLSIYAKGILAILLTNINPNDIEDMLNNNVSEVGYNKFLLAISELEQYKYLYWKDKKLHVTGKF